MINYLEKYNNLPKDLRDKISAPHVMEAIHNLENRYTVSLAALVMRVVVKDIKVNELQNFFVYNIGISADKASALVQELKDGVFSEFANYIDYISSSEVKDDISENYFDDVPIATGQNNPEELKFESDNVSPKTGADFYFSIEDEDEVRQQAKDFGNLDKREQLAKQVEGKIEDVIGQINVIFSSADMLNRLKTILKTYLRGVRDKMDTKLAMERDIENGGLGLEDEMSDDILKIVDSINQLEAQHPGRVYAPRKFSLPEDAQANMDGLAQTKNSGDVAYDFSQLRKNDQQKNNENKKESEEDPLKPFKSEIEIEDDVISNELGNAIKNSFAHEASNMEVLDYDEADGEKSGEEKNEDDEDDEDVEDQDLSEKDEGLVLDLSKLSSPNFEKGKQAHEKPEPEIDEEQVADTFAAGMMAKARNAAPLDANYKTNLPKPNESSGRVRMEDIKKISKIGGPLEEISSMNLADFRRINKDPEVAVGRILGMFELLEEESYAKRLEGVKAWRQSPINKLYLAIGQESIIRQKDIETVIAERQKDKKDYLSKQEFNAIMGLNKSLRY